MDVPHYILDLLTEELREMQIKLLKKVATRHGLDHAGLVAEFAPPPDTAVAIVPNTEIAITVQKTQPRRTPKSGDNRCMARVWNRGKGGQCTRARCNGTGVAGADDSGAGADYCSQHIEKRKHGRIDESVPKDTFPKKPVSLYK